MKVAVIDQDSGFVTCIWKPFREEPNIVDGTIDDNGRLLKLIDESVDPDDFIARMIWLDGAWFDRGLPPSRFYVWEGEWVLGEEYFKEAERVRQRKLVYAKLRDNLSPLKQKRAEMQITALRNLDISKWDDIDAIDWPKEVL